MTSNLVKSEAGALVSEKCHCAKTIMKELHKFELARLMKMKKKERKRFWPSGDWFGIFAMVFSATGCVVCHENTKMNGRVL